MKKQLAVFASGTGSNFEAIARACAEGVLNAEVAVMVCDKPGAAVIEKAERFGVETFVFAPKEYAGKAAYEEEIVRILDARQLDDDAPCALPLDDRLGEPQLVDAFFHDAHDALHGVVVHLRLFGILRLEDDVGTALQVKSLTNGESQRLYKCQENANNGHDTDNQFHEIILSQEISSPFVFRFALYSLTKSMTLSRTSAALYLSV